MFQQFDHEAIKTMLNQGMPHIKIAARVGCSRERVRQLDLKYFGFTGNQRRCERREERLALEAEAVPNHPFVKECQRRTFNVRGVFRSNSSVLVNGKLCLLRSSARHSCGSKTGRMYQVIRHIRLPADFYIHKVSATLFFIIPAYAQPAGDTSVALDRISNRGAYSFRHDYQKYLNAWDLLGRTQ